MGGSGSAQRHERIEQARDYVRDNAALRAAIGAPPDADFQLEELGEGEHNRNYRFSASSEGPSYVLRVNVVPQPFHDNQVAYEFAALRALEPSGCAPAPLYLEDSPRALGKGVIVESYCEGRLLDFDHLQPHDVECALALMADIHAVEVPRDTLLHKPADPLCDLFEECLDRFGQYRSSAYEDARITKWVERFLAEARRAVESSACREEDACHIVNTEPLPSHFLLPDGSDASRGAFIDWERPIIGEVAQDVAYFLAPTTTFWDSEFLFPARDVDAAIATYWDAVDGRFPAGNFEERFRAFRLMTSLRSVTWCCRALIFYNDSSHHRTPKTERKLPVYLSDDFMHLIAEECLG